MTGKSEREGIGAFIFRNIRIERRGGVSPPVLNANKPGGMNGEKPIIRSPMYTSKPGQIIPLEGAETTPLSIGSGIGKDDCT